MQVLNEYGLLLVATVLVNNFVLAKFLGLCPFMGVSGSLSSSLGMSMATAFVLTLASVLSYLSEVYLIIPFDISALRIIIFILIIAISVQFTEILVKKISASLYRSLGIYLPLITTNCAVLGVALLNSRKSHDLISSAVYGFGAALGFALVMVLFSSIREKIDSADTPEAFKGSSIAMLTAGLMSIVFMGFKGLIK